MTQYIIDCGDQPTLDDQLHTPQVSTCGSTNLVSMLNEKTNSDSGMLYNHVSVG